MKVQNLARCIVPANMKLVNFSPQNHFSERWVVRQRIPLPLGNTWYGVFCLCSCSQHSPDVNLTNPVLIVDVHPSNGLNSSAVWTMIYFTMFIEWIKPHSTHSPRGEEGGDSDWRIISAKDCDRMTVTNLLRH